MARRIVICADDYGLAPGVSRAIRELALAGRLNATSVMTLFPDLEGEAEALLQVGEATDLGIGLHLTLTGGFAPLVAAPTGAGRLPGLRDLIVKAHLRRLDLAAVEDEIEAQFSAFSALFGRPPSHVDGHQHAHVLPGIRALVLRATRRHAPSAWLRDSSPSSGVGEGLDLKGKLIGLFSAGLRRDATAAGLTANTGFAGAYSFNDANAFQAVLARALARLPDGGAVMVHPGHVDAVLAARDPITGQREAEYQALAGSAFGKLLEKNEIVLR
ncbi:ChbG/HpnK family deacetylase [Aquabacter sp. L1I39]|uniref:ChbG/HpnK family deacetylase n=1 Tax=Aquabacter sp. L1I39 TaxID=2820278 RepID=UPI001ADB703D|nr:ChbG/HpnK family deacetylase [Aquabacter sp. L1I39]QTL01678.1 ChbG/HpnK family deacetylase [Aquabacter sp. L1I39]